MTGMTREEMRVLARRNVAGWPPLTKDEHDRLYILLAPMRAWLKEHAAEQRADTTVPPAVVSPGDLPIDQL